MNKDWKKRFDEEFGTPADLMGWMEFNILDMAGKVKAYDATKKITSDLKKFISQVEKDAIDKTNKRWRRKVQKAIDSLVLDYDSNNEEDKRVADISDGTLFILEEKLSDLLKG